MVELLSPAGNVEKLRVAFSYGADAAYMGLTEFSLRKNADNFTPEELEEVRELKQRTGKKLYCAMNILFKERQIEKLWSMKDEIGKWPFDAFIVSDLGALPFFKENFPDKELHLSTQASCVNSSSASMYSKLGFDRIILGREASLDDIKRIKDKCPEVELEVFVHGAMCMAYSGRCLLSAALVGRSGNQGDCAHACRWHYRLEEAERPGEYFPIEEMDGYTTILSSKDLCMIDHIQELIDAGVSSFKIEGRMKSVYYVAVTTRAYRKMIDRDPDALTYRQDLFNVSHRTFTTGFFFNEAETAQANESYERNYMFLGSVLGGGDGLYSLDVRNHISSGDRLEFITPDVPFLSGGFELLDGDLQPVGQLDHGKPGYIRTSLKLPAGAIIRKETGKQ